MLNTFGFVPSNNFVNKLPDHTRPGNAQYFEYCQWEYIYPPDEEFIVPRICPIVPDYKPVGEWADYWDFTQYGIGYGSIELAWQILEADDVARIRQAYTFALNYTNGRVWLYTSRFDKGMWHITSGQMEPPEESGFEGDNSLEFKLRFSRLGFHLNDPSNVGQVGIFGDHQFKNEPLLL